MAVHWRWNRLSLPDKQKQWLAKNGQWLAIGLAVPVLVIAFRLGNWADWTGFKGKTLWEWFDLLVVPVSLAILGYFLQRQQQKQAAEAAREQRETAANEEKEEILQVYFDRLSTLLVDKNLLAIAAKVHPEKGEPTATHEEQELFDAAVDVIRARTLSILRRFEGDASRKTSVVRFLLEAEVISKTKLSLRLADLSGADLSLANLGGAHLSGANLSNANLSFANLSGARLIGTNLSSAELIDTDLSNANLNLANLSGAYFSGADLSNANLSDATLTASRLSNVNLNNVNLSSAKLCRTVLPDGVDIDPQRNCEELGIAPETGLPTT
ncbi:hypothetical protein C7271_19780 [filamentous cyanobacterium CCP5]|nr:hypothetical protein C7271_19780 [filamentous cyanobacterium CCP5]